jgi:raffinose/stachyose/melibiose transport system substrate-binding protein
VGADDDVVSTESSGEAGEARIDRRALVRRAGALALSAPLAGGVWSAGAAAATRRVHTARGAELKLMHWHRKMAPDDPTWKSILAGFTKQHPGLKITNTYVPFPQYFPKLTALDAANSLPDVFYAVVQAQILGDAGKVIDFKKNMPASFLARFEPHPLASYTWNGKIYGLPWASQFFAFFLNNEIMGKLKLSAPQTWDDLVAMAPKINSAGYIPLVFGNQARNVASDFFLPIIKQEGGDVRTLDDHTKPGVTWVTPPVIKALTLVNRLREQKVLAPGINGISEEQGRQIFFQGRAAMHYSLEILPGIITEQAPKSLQQSYSVAKVPALHPGAKHWTGNSAGDSWSVKDGANKNLSLEFLNYLFSPSVYNRWIASTQQPPSIKGATGELKNPKILQMAKWLSDGTEHILFGDGTFDAVSKALEGVLDGSSSPQAAAKQIEDSVRKTRKK